MHDLSAGAWLNLCVATCQLQTTGLDKVLEEVEERFALEEVALEWKVQWLEGQEERRE